MNKTELIAAVAERAEMSKKDAEAAVTATVDVIAEALRKGEKVQLVGFGSFEVKTRAERMGRNPQTKEPIPIPKSGFRRNSFIALAKSTSRSVPLVLASTPCSRLATKPGSSLYFSGMEPPPSGPV